jgi:hypothetical protein
MTRKLGLLAVLAFVALIGASCADEAAKNDNATAGQPPALRFAECMRDNGVSEFPDPDASGELTIDGVLNGSSLDPESATWKRAVTACKDLQPPGFTGDEEVTPSEHESRLEFAQCMRDNGVKDFPDPADGEPLVNTYVIPSSNTGEGMTILNAAMQTCGDVAEQAAGQ